MNKIMLTGRLSTEIKMEKSGDYKYGNLILLFREEGKKAKQTL